MAEFEKSSGITLKFTDASQSFDTLIRPRVQGNNPPTSRCSRSPA